MKWFMISSVHTENQHATVNYQLKGSFGIPLINSFTVYNILLNHRWLLVSTETTINVSDSDVTGWEEMADHRCQRVAVWHWSLWLQPLRSGNRHPATLTQKLRRPKNQCDVIPDSSPESRWAVGRWINFDPVWKGNLLLWWRGHTAALLDWHEW